MSKTTEALKLAEEALVYHTQQTRPIQKTDEAIAAIREVLAESKPAPDGRIPKTVFTLDDISKAAEMGRQAGMIDALAEPVKQEPVAWVNAERNTITWEKIYPNMEPLYAAPVSAKREWVELTDDEIFNLGKEKKFPDTDPVYFGNTVIAAFKDKNK